LDARINLFQHATRHHVRSIALEQAGAGLEKIVAGSLQRIPAAEAPLMAWPMVCGSAVAERSRAVSFSEGVLRIEVADAGWRHELQSLAPRYLAVINQYVRQTVTRIEFVIVADRTASESLP
jgi:Dna[CI] antecedent DciA-like protein